MEVNVKSHFEDEDDPYSVLVPNLQKVLTGNVHAILDLELTNHRSDRPERIIGCWAELRCRRLLLWKRTLANISVETSSVDDYELKYPIENIYLEPMGKPQKLTVRVWGSLGLFRMPKRSELVIVFRMVGPIRKYVRRLTPVDYDPKQVPDRLDCKT